MVVLLWLGSHQFVTVLITTGVIGTFEFYKYKRGKLAK